MIISHTSNFSATFAVQTNAQLGIICATSRYISVFMWITLRLYYKCD